jgi:8-oxo-dGTP pyrophosphatase MutT (NUDIX family)
MTSTRYEIYEQKPEGFSTPIEVAATYVNLNGKILFLKLAHNKPEANSWGVPAGKLEVDELPADGAKRELFEETGISIDSSTAFQSLGKLFFRKNVDFVYHLFGLNLSDLPGVQLSMEHTDHKWVSRHEAENINLMAGAKEALDIYFQRSSKKTRTGASVNAHLVLLKDDQVLLHLRKNTGYYDNFYGLVSGHVEDGESGSTAMIREAYEEAGITIEPSSLKAIHVIHRQTSRFNIDLFFECREWQGKITNTEPDICGGLEFFPLNQLPHNTINYVQDALKAISKGEYYSESGWKHS